MRPLKRKAKFIPVLIPVLISGVWALHIASSGLWPSRIDFAFEHAKLNRLVRAVLAKYPPSPLARTLRVNSSLDPASLHLDTSKDGYSMKGQISVITSAPGVTHIWIITSDQGHLGAYGYLYSNAPLRVLRNNETEDEYLKNYWILPEPVLATEKLSSHWYVGKNDNY